MHTCSRAHLHISSVQDGTPSASFQADVVVEFIAPDDAMVQRLRRNRDALDFGYTQDRFEACISAHFVIAKTEPLQSGTRTMYFARPTRTGPGG